MVRTVAAIRKHSRIGHDGDIPSQTKPTVLATPGLPYPAYTTENIALSAQPVGHLIAPVVLCSCAPRRSQRLGAQRTAGVPYDLYRLRKMMRLSIQSILKLPFLS